MDWTVKPDTERDISITEINLSARQAVHQELYQSQTNRDIFEIINQFYTTTDAPVTEQLQHHLKRIKKIPVVGDGCLVQGLDPRFTEVIGYLTKRTLLGKLTPRTLINSDTFTVMFSCLTAKSLHNLWKLTEDGDLSDIMKSLMFVKMKHRLGLESLSLEATIDAEEYRRQALQYNSDGAGPSGKSIQSQYLHIINTHIIYSMFYYWFYIK